MLAVRAVPRVLRVHAGRRLRLVQVVERVFERRLDGFDRRHVHRNELGVDFVFVSVRTRRTGSIA
jgi:hypothetical protein